MTQPFKREDRASVLYRHLDADGELDMLCEELYESVQHAVNAYRRAKLARGHIVDANRIISAAGCKHPFQPDCPDCANTGVDHGEKCNTCRGKSREAVSA